MDIKMRKNEWKNKLAVKKNIIFIVRFGKVI